MAVQKTDITALPETPENVTATLSDADTPAMMTGEAPEPPPAKPARLRSLDAFRGLTIVLMLLVNNIALDTATPKQLLHAHWNTGVTLADFVFPWFLFCVGVAIPFAASSFHRKGLPSWLFDVRVISRAAVLVLLGCLVDSIQRHPVLSLHPLKLHIDFTLGVLQIIGLAYLVAALLYELPAIRRVLIAGGMLVAYWAAIMYIPIPGAGAGVLLENQNLIQHLNLQYLNAVRLWGLPSLIPTAALVIIASVIGDLVRLKELKTLQRVGALLLAGVVLMIGGLLWNQSLPFNKPLWTPAYILLTAGAATLVLALFYVVLDVRQWWQWSFPLLVFGSNAIVAYVVPILTKYWVFTNWHIGKPGNIMHVDQWLLHAAKVHYGPLTGGWVFTWGYIFAWWLVLWLLYWRKWFLRV